MFVLGPYLVRSAVYDKKKKTLHLTGDDEEATSVTVFASKKLRSITWNGEKVATKSSHGGMYEFSIDGPARFELSPLGGWKWADSLPEITNNYTLSKDVWIGKDSHLQGLSQWRADRVYA